MVVERMAIFDVLLSLTRYGQDCGLNMCRPQFIYDSKLVKAYLFVNYDL